MNLASNDQNQIGFKRKLLIALKLVQVLFAAITLVLTCMILYQYDQTQLVVFLFFSFFTIIYHSIKGDIKEDMLRKSTCTIAMSSILFVLFIVQFIYSLVNINSYKYQTESYTSMMIANEVLEIISVILFIISVIFEKKLKKSNDQHQNVQYSLIHQVQDIPSANQLNYPVQINQNQYNTQINQQPVYQMQQAFQVSHQNVTVIPQSQQLFLQQPIIINGTQSLQVQGQPISIQPQFSDPLLDNKF
eukprot:403348448